MNTHKTVKRVCELTKKRDLKSNEYRNIVPPITTKEIWIPSTYDRSGVSLNFYPLVNHTPCSEFITLPKRLNLTRK